MKSNCFNKKSTFIGLILIAASHATYSQTVLLIKSSADNSSLPLATISNISKKASYSADEKGLAKIKATTGDTLLITYVGYSAKQVIVKQGRYYDTIFMSRLVNSLQEVYIMNCKHSKDYILSNSKNRKSTYNFLGISCSKGNYNARAAVKIQNGQNNGKLSSISFWLKRGSVSAPPAYAFRSPFIISFYSISELNLPGKLLYQDPLFYFPQKEGKQELSVDSLGVQVPAEGVFVCFEFIMDERYQWEEKVQDTSFIHQGVMVEGENSDGFELCFYDYKKNSWDHAWNENSQKANQGTIRIEATVKYCK